MRVKRPLPWAAMPLLIPLLMLAGMQAAPAVPGIFFAPPAQTVDLGDPAFVDVVVAPDGELISSYDMDIFFDTSILTVSSVTFGTALDAGFGPFQDAIVDEIGGVITVSELTDAFDIFLETSQDGVTPFTIFTIAFDTDATGTSALTIGPSSIFFPAPILGDESGAPLDASLETGAITVVDPGVPTVPAPPAVLLVAAGLLLLGRRARA